MMKKYELYKSMMNLFNFNFKYTDNQRSSLINIANGVILDDKSADVLLGSKQTGIEKTKKFFSEKFHSGKFWEKHSKSKISTKNWKKYLFR